MAMAARLKKIPGLRLHQICALKKSISGTLEIGAHFPSFNFTNPLIWGDSSSPISQVTTNGSFGTETGHAKTRRFNAFKSGTLRAMMDRPVVLP
jgi:hypothetical protein